MPSPLFNLCLELYAHHISFKLLFVRICCIVSTSVKQQFAFKFRNSSSQLLAQVNIGQQTTQIVPQELKRKKYVISYLTLKITLLLFSFERKSALVESVDILSANKELNA